MNGNNGLDGVTIEIFLSKLREKCTNCKESRSSSDILVVIDETLMQKIKTSTQSDNSSISEKDINVESSMNKKQLI